MLKSYRLFFLIAITFLIEALILLRIVSNVVQNEELSIVELIIKNTTQLSILMMITTLIYLVFTAILEQRDNDKNDFAKELLTRMLINSFSASIIPIGISLILCAFTDIRYIKYLSGIEIAIGFIGIALMSITVLSIYREEVVSKNDVL